MIFYIVAMTSLLMDALYGIGNKYIVTQNDEDSPVKIFIWMNIWSILLVLVLYATGSSESGLPPWTILQQMPVIILADSSTVIYMLCYAFSLRFIKLTIVETILAITPACIISGMILIYLVSGKLSGATKLLTFQNGVPLIILFIAIWALRRVSNEKTDAKENGTERGLNERNYKYIVLGVILAVIALFADASDSLITTFMLNETQTGLYDYTIGYVSVGVIYATITYFYLWIKNKKPYNPFRKAETPKAACTFGNILLQLCYGAALDMNPVKYNVMWAAYPILPVLLSRIILKEKCTKKQYICIAIVILMSFLLNVGLG